MKSEIVGSISQTIKKQICENGTSNIKKTLTFLIQVNSVKSVEFLAFESCKGYWKNISVTYDNILVAVLKCQINVKILDIFITLWAARERN